MNNEYRLTKFVQAAGWAAKMGSADLKQTLCKLNEANENLIVGFNTSDDAGVFKLSDDLALVQTLDFITPVVDDPYIYGQIAAANSLSDIFAMGAEVKTALNIVGFDKKNVSSEALSLILEGGNSKIKECGGILLGGHTIESPEMYYGLSVTGLINPRKVIRNNGAKAGDLLVLSKPLGMGVLTTAIKRDLLDIAYTKMCASIMATLNQKASILMQKYGANSCTDITGFGFLGHLYECLNDNTSFEIFSKEVPILNKAFDFAKDGVVPGGSKKNLKFLEQKVEFSQNVDDITKILLCDAQTSGGLLVAMSEKNAKEYLKELKDSGHESASIVGVVKEKNQTKDKDIFVSSWF